LFILRRRQRQAEVEQLVPKLERLIPDFEAAA